LQQVDAARADFALIAADIDFLKKQLARLPSRAYVSRVALMAMLSGSGLTILLALAFWHSSEPDSPSWSWPRCQPRWERGSTDRVT
jgi:hypothetical protein